MAYAFHRDAGHQSRGRLSCPRAENGFWGHSCLRNLPALGENPFETANYFLMVDSSCPLAFQFLEYSWWFPGANLQICFSFWQKCFALWFWGPLPFLSTTYKLRCHLLKLLSLINLLDFVSLPLLKHPIFAFHYLSHLITFHLLVYFFMLPPITSIAINKIITNALLWRTHLQPHEEVRRAGDKDGHTLEVLKEGRVRLETTQLHNS